MLAATLAIALTAPVPGDVVRDFDYGADPFAPGQHRGVDLAARPGVRVVAACTGRVVAAGEVAGRNLVSLDCGPYRVSHLPLEQVKVTAGARVTRGAPIGTAAPGHGGLHLGVRRRADPFGYVDPGALMRAPAPPPSMPAAPRSVARRSPPPRPAPMPKARTAPSRPPPTTAPWSAYAGLGLLTAGLVTSGIRRRRRAEVGRSRAWNRESASSRWA